MEANNVVQTKNSVKIMFEICLQAYYLENIDKKKRKSSESKQK